MKWGDDKKLVLGSPGPPKVQGWPFKATKAPLAGWVRGTPSNPVGTMPYLVRSGTPGELGSISRPDILYMRITQGPHLTAEILDIEHCGTLQNAQDKRARLMPNNASQLLRLPEAWLAAMEPAKKAKKARWELIGFDSAPTADVDIPISSARLVLLVSDVDFPTARSRMALDAHEYLAPHSALDKPYSEEWTRLWTHAFGTRVYGEIG